MGKTDKKTEGTNTKLENKAPENKTQEFKPSAPKGNVGAKVGCQADGCKSNPVRLEFCNEHFNQYKFGLIKKTGEPVFDYEKKLEHYARWKSAQKVA